ncbi:hypothetical protein [Mycobacterium sp. ENV421]|nr:hypothetical protein [Mycobacterium sp. ENV421]
MSRMSRATWFSGLLVGLGVGAALLAGGVARPAPRPGDHDGYAVVIRLS